MTSSSPLSSSYSSSSLLIMPPSEVDAARHVCEEIRVVVSSLTAGPPDVAYGALSGDLRSLRARILHDPCFLRHPSNAAEVSRPFLAVIADPTAAGPHTHVALRALHRLVERGSIRFGGTEKEEEGSSGAVDPHLDAVVVGVVGCKFEQTDAGSDEAVEMAIADLLALLVGLRPDLLHPETYMDAFHTVFLTRNTFVHSPALCYHFEEVLVGMVGAAFTGGSGSGPRSRRRQRQVEASPCTHPLSVPDTPTAAVRVLEFLVQQLLHTPYRAGGSEAQAAHDATRILCLRLARGCLRSPAFASSTDDNDDPEATRLIGDELCLSLLLMGQSFWSLELLTPLSAGSGIVDEGNDTSFWAVRSNGLSTEVLSEICSTVSALWSCAALRKRLESQFEALFCGFFQRALSLLRRVRVPQSSQDELANLMVDAEIEVVLETLVDLLCLDDDDEKEGKTTLEVLYRTYDCAVHRSDVATGLVMELCRCCYGGGTSIGSGDGVGPTMSGVPEDDFSFSYDNEHEDDDDDELSKATATTVETSNSRSTAAVPASSSSSRYGPPPYRPVPPRLAEHCAEALRGCLRGWTSSLMSPSPSVSRPLKNVGGGFSQEQQEHEGKLRLLRRRKCAMRRGVALFNAKPRKGIAHLEEHGLTSDPATPAEVASFLRTGLALGLDKAAIGSYLGEAGVGVRAVASSSSSSSSSPTKTIAKNDPSPPQKVPHVCERDWFHRQVLSDFIGTFRFENQGLLEGLRMFLSSFRLPGEAQQIDRILQAFADGCGRVCRERPLLPADPVRASDAAYLLAFSIIMLNTDRHNQNIRADRKMSCEDFVRNNTNYGADISGDMDFPREFLEDLYKSICEEEIRTENEGAEGRMTVERWKDVLRTAGRGSSGDGEESATPLSSSASSAEDQQDDDDDNDEVKLLMLEGTWKLLLTSVHGFWDRHWTSSSGYSDGADGEGHYIKEDDNDYDVDINNNNYLYNGVRATQARLGIDMGVALLSALRGYGMVEAHRRAFLDLCRCSGLLPTSTSVRVLSTTPRSSGRSQPQRPRSISVYGQAAVVVAVHHALDAGDDLSVDGWECLWTLMLELRDRGLLPLQFSSSCGGENAENTNTNTNTTDGPFHGLVVETDPDLLTPRAREAVRSYLATRTADGDPRPKSSNMSRTGSGLGLFGRLFSFADAATYSQTNSLSSPSDPLDKSGLVLWDALPDDDDINDRENRPGGFDNDARVVKSYRRAVGRRYLSSMSQGDTFEAVLSVELEDRRNDGDGSGENDYIQPTMAQEEFYEKEQVAPLLEGGQGIDPDRPNPHSSNHTNSEDHDNDYDDYYDALHFDSDGRQLRPSQRVRCRLAASCDFPALISSSRYLSLEGIRRLLQALIGLLPTTMATTTTTKRVKGKTLPSPPIVSPASEALVEIVICEVALKNRDRIRCLWENPLKAHYHARLTISKPTVRQRPGLEKCVTGLLRISYRMVDKTEVADHLLQSLGNLMASDDDSDSADLERLPAALTTDKEPNDNDNADNNNTNSVRSADDWWKTNMEAYYVGEALWRLCRGLESSSTQSAVSDRGWRALAALVHTCASRGGKVVRTGPRRGGLAEDDPALMAFRSLHLVLHSRPSSSGNDDNPTIQTNTNINNTSTTTTSTSTSTANTNHHYYPTPWVVEGLVLLIRSGEQGGCSKLVVASLDLLLLCHRRWVEEGLTRASPTTNETWADIWCTVLQGMAGVASSSSFVGVRQHALSMLTDAMLLDGHDARTLLTGERLATVLRTISIPLASQRFRAVTLSSSSSTTTMPQTTTQEEATIELELGINLLFKPLNHYLEDLLEDRRRFLEVWISVLRALAHLLDYEEPRDPSHDHDHERHSGEGESEGVDVHRNGDVRSHTTAMAMATATSRELASEHLRNSVMVLTACGAIQTHVNSDSDTDTDELTAVTWKTVRSFRFCRNHSKEWILGPSPAGTPDKDLATHLSDRRPPHEDASGEETDGSSSFDIVPFAEDGVMEHGKGQRRR